MSREATPSPSRLSHLSRPCNEATIPQECTEKLLPPSPPHLPYSTNRMVNIPLNPSAVGEDLSQSSPVNFDNQSASREEENLADFALAAFSQSDYRSSLFYFREILKSYPACSADVRMWIGHCLCKLGDFDKARTAYSRALQLDPHCVGAKTGSAFLEAREGKMTESMSLLIGVVNEATPPTLEPLETLETHSILSTFGALELFREEFCVLLNLDYSIEIVECILKNSSVDGQLPSKYACTLARRCQVEEEYESAFHFYQIAVEYSQKTQKNNSVLLFGLGQIFLQRGDFEKSIDCFEKILQTNADCFDAMRLLGLIYNRLGCVEKKDVARRYLSCAAEAFPDDCGVKVKLAEELEVVDKVRKEAALTDAVRRGGLKPAHPKCGPKPAQDSNGFSGHESYVRHNGLSWFRTTFQTRALELYLSVYRKCQTMKESSDHQVHQVQPVHEVQLLELLNNISALYFAMGDFQNSRKYLSLALACLNKDETETSQNKVFSTTLLYNKGRLDEIFHDFSSAEESYFEVLSEQPAYADAYFRLGHIALARNNPSQAFTWFTELTESTESTELNPLDLEGEILKGDLLTRRGEFEAACRHFESLLKNQNSEETFLMLKLGNACVDVMRQGAVDAGRKKQLVEKAFENFQRVLKLDPTNPYAVNGMGVVLASIGFQNAALEMFRLVHECDPHVVDACLNLGHTYCAQKEYQKAVQVYRQCADTCTGGLNPDSEIYFYLARACFLNGDLKEAERSLQKALHLTPDSPMYQRNLSPSPMYQPNLSPSSPYKSNLGLSSMYKPNSGLSSLYKFNLGLVLKALAISTLKERHSSLSAVENAVSDLHTAQDIFQNLLEEKASLDERACPDEKRLRKEVAVTFNFLNQSASHLERACFFAAQTAKKQKRTANQLLVTDHFPMRKNDQGKRQAASGTSSGTLSGTKGKMARQQVRAGECSPLKKRTHKNAQLEESLIDFKQIVSNTQREPQRKRVKAIVGDGNDRRRRRFADRKRRELQIERNTVVSSDEDLSPKFRPVRRRCFAPPSTRPAKKMARPPFDESSDVCSSVDVSENDMCVPTDREEVSPRTAPVLVQGPTLEVQTPTALVQRPVEYVHTNMHTNVDTNIHTNVHTKVHTYVHTYVQVASQKRGQSSSEKPMVLKRFFKSQSDEALLPASYVEVVNVPAVLKRNFSDGDAVPVRETVTDEIREESKGLVDSLLTDVCTYREVAVVEEAREKQSVSCSTGDSDSDSAKRHHNSDSEPESRKRKSSLHASEAAEER